jgi:hypothetical protein
MTSTIEITPRAIELFKRQQLAAAEWWRLDWELHAELKLSLSEGCPTIVMPADPDVYPSASAGNQWHARGQRLYRRLCELAGIEPSLTKTSPP